MNGSGILTLKRVKTLAYVVALVFLMVHVTMLALFARYQVLPMAGFNIFSITFYMAMILLIRKGHLFSFVIATFLEVCMHMGLAVFFTGWDGGFQITLIGICFLATYAEYVGRTMGIRYVPSMVMALVSMLTYVASYISTLIRPAPYALPERVNSFLQIAWALTTFTIMSVVLQIFVFVTTRSQEELAREVMHDELTGLPNRFYMAKYFNDLWEDPDKSGYWIAIADLDDFKAVNDTYGHNCGDAVLQTLAQRLKELPEGIKVCRWGGEEFLLVGHRSVAEPTEELERLRQTVSELPFCYEEHQFHLTLTIGVAWYDSERTVSAWINTADQKLYEGKQAGKDRVLVA